MSSRLKKKAGSKPNAPPNGTGSGRLFRSLLDFLHVGVAHASRNGEILYANPRFAQILGCPPDESLIGSDLKRVIPAHDWLAFKEALVQGALRPTEGDMRVIRSGCDNPLAIRFSFSPLDRQHETIGIVATEVTELVQATEALKEKETSLQVLSARLLQLQDEERRRMARDLHDVTGQELAITIMSLDRVKKASLEAREETRQAIDEAVTRLRKVESQIRTLSYVLHPPLLDEMGLRSALHHYIDGFSKRTGVQVEAEIPADLPRFATDTEMALFRIVQEALANVFRHSGSRKAWVRVSLSDAGVETNIKDAGRGFADKSALVPQKGGVGIQSMRGRIELVGGSLALRTGLQGTEVTACVPLEVAGILPAVMPKIQMSGNVEDQSSPVGGSANGHKRILIADDHAVAREGMRALLKDMPDIEICGEAVDGLDALAKTRKMKPDLLILDLSMPHMKGFSVANQIRNEGLPTKIIIYTTHSYPELERMARAGNLDGFVVKSNAALDLIRAVTMVLAGQKFYGSDTSAARAHSA